MARTRGAAINESVEELDQLRQYYKGKPVARRLLFLYMLKIDVKSTISSAAEKVGISERRGRYWWDSYRKRGLQGLLDRRVWGQNDLLKLESDEEYRGDFSEGNNEVGGDAGGSGVAFINELSSIAQNYEGEAIIDEMKRCIVEYIPEVDYVVFNIRYSVNIIEREEGMMHVLRYHVSEDGPTENVSGSSRDYQYTYKQLIEDGKQRGFPFERYHFPPSGFDFYLDGGRRDRSKQDLADTYIGSVLLFRSVSEDPISMSTVGFIERIRPFLSFLLTFIIAKKQLKQPGSGSMSKVVQAIASDAGLTLREQRVLTLIYNGSSYAEIARLLYVSLNTVQTHVKNIFVKTKVNKMGELFAKYFSPVFFEEKSTDE